MKTTAPHLLFVLLVKDIILSDAFIGRHLSRSSLLGIVRIAPSPDSSAPQNSSYDGQCKDTSSEPLSPIDRIQPNGGALAPISLNGQSREATRRKIELLVCGRDEESCTDVVIRERVVGEHNNFEFEGPATGQVCYVWDDPPSMSTTRAQSVLLLVKQGDEELLQTAAEAVNELIQTDGLQVLMVPELCAKMKHYYGVDDKKMKLYEPVPVPGFGGNHVALDDELMGIRPVPSPQDQPDLICSLGGDGLLMHAGMMFQGFCPPVLGVAGGSLGFLTRFSRDEMVDAIKLSLGLIQSDEKDDGKGDPTEIRPSYKYSINKMSQFSLGAGQKINISMRMRLDVRVINQEGVVRARFNVLNEVVIDRGNSPYLAALECFVDDIHLTTVQADGVIFAT
jgi:NAD kinase